MTTTRSALTVAELRAQAMLLGDGWSYDPDDHTFTKINRHVRDESRLRLVILDADTMEQINIHNSACVDLDRFQYVVCGRLGAVDYDQWKKEFLAYD